jgi:hypothetical protein
MNFTVSISMMAPFSELNSKNVSSVVGRRGGWPLGWQ